MISIRSAISELETCDQLRLQTLGCYAAAIQNMAHYAVELNEEITNPYRKYLTAVAEGIASGTAEALEESRATVRALLRDYRDRASHYLNHMREELAQTASALQDICGTLNQAEGDHEGQLRESVKSLRQVATATDLETIRTAVLAEALEIERSLEELHQQNRAIVSEFLTEIRVLHKRIDTLENAATLDALTQTFNRAEMEKRIAEAQDGASLLLVRIRGIGKAEKEFSREVAEELTGAFAKRLRNNLTPAAVLGRWGREQFLAIGPPGKAEAVSAAKWIGEHLSGVYACLQEGKTVRPAIQVDAMVVERGTGADAEQVLRQVREYLG